MVVVTERLITHTHTRLNRKALLQRRDLGQCLSTPLPTLHPTERDVNRDEAWHCGPFQVQSSSF
jgi:hypothetical protein